MILKEAQRLFILCSPMQNFMWGYSCPDSTTCCDIFWLLVIIGSILQVIHSRKYFILLDVQPKSQSRTAFQRVHTSEVIKNHHNNNKQKTNKQTKHKTKQNHKRKATKNQNKTRKQGKLSGPGNAFSVHHYEIEI